MAHFPPGADLTGSQSGQASVVYGSSLGPTSLSLTNLDGNNGFSINGVSGAERSGLGVAMACDLNGNGLCDVLVGAPAADPSTGNNAGQVIIIYGSSTSTVASIDAGSLTDQEGAMLIGPNGDMAAGTSVDGCGDFNGDSRFDFVVGKSIFI